MQFRSVPRSIANQGILQRKLWELSTVPNHMASFVKPRKASNLRSGLSKWELDELTKERRKKLTKQEIRREKFADGLRCPLCFCLPCAIIALILLILMGVYIVHPYQVGKSDIELFFSLHLVFISSQVYVFITSQFNYCNNSCGKYFP